jgi:hypothetical protein
MYTSLPRPRANLIVRPENFETLSQSGQDKNRSFWRVETEQVDGFYKFTSFHKPDWDQTLCEHKVALPLLHRRYWFARVYDEKINIKESQLKTKVSAIYGAEFAAKFNHREERWIFDLGKESSRRRWGIIVKGKAESPKVESKDAPENYAMNYNFNF